jgi:hypothetical protein
MANYLNSEKPVVSTVALPSTKLSEKLLLVKGAAASGDYTRAILVLPADNREPEFLNCRAVCLLRMHRFEEAVDLLRGVVLSPGTVILRSGVPRHYAVNFAIALFYGGRPAGAIDILDELNSEQDESVRKFRQSIDEWVRSMSFFARLDWKLNRIPPKKLPTVPAFGLGQFTWDLA